MEAIAERPTLQEQRVAQESLPPITQALAKKQTQSDRIRLQAEGFSMTIPTKALHLLALILDHMAQGKAVSLVPTDSELSTQQAAQLLNVSRPHVVKLVEQGVIPFKKAGTHRRILLGDLLAYQARQKQQRQEALAFLSEQAQALHLGYE
jgi:excisionase family DNA binding protein